MQNENGNHQYLTEKDVAKITRLSLATLRNDRFLSRGIPYVKIGRSVRYNLEDVIGYMESHKINLEKYKETLV